MTFDDRVDALAPLGLTPRQTAFLVTVALHSGYCLRRHYAAFAGVQHGKNVRLFLEKLVAQRLARRTRYRADRGYLYHLHAKALYRAIGQPENRNRRTASAPFIAQRLMLLDHVLSAPAAAWFATEAEKVALFTERFGVPRADLPQRTYGPLSGSTRTTRYFVHKLPIALAGDPPTVHLVFLATEPGGQACATFLRDHGRLLQHLPTWRLVAVAPRHGPGLAACQAVFEAYARAGRLLVPRLDPADLRWYFLTRQAVERDQIAHLSVAELDRFRQARRRFSPPVFESLYANWCLRGDAVFLERVSLGGDQAPTPGRLILHALPHAYGQFGSLVGVG